MRCGLRPRHFHPGAARCRTPGSGAGPSEQASRDFRRCGFQPRPFLPRSARAAGPPHLFSFLFSLFTCHCLPRNFFPIIGKPPENFSNHWKIPPFSPPIGNPPAPPAAPPSRPLHPTRCTTPAPLPEVRLPAAPLPFHSPPAPWWGELSERAVFPPAQRAHRRGLRPQ